MRREPEPVDAIAIAMYNRQAMIEISGLDSRLQFLDPDDPNGGPRCSGAKMEKVLDARYVDRWCILPAVLVLAATERPHQSE